MDGRGRALDNAFIERLWRTVKYEHVYLHDYTTLGELRSGLQTFFQHYNFHRPHQALKYRTPAEVFFKTGSNKERILLYWGSAPNPGIYRCFLPEWMTFLLAGTSLSLTIEMLDRKTGQRRDATRAPIQARNGWRLYATTLYSPAPNKNGRKTVQRMGSTSLRRRCLAASRSAEDPIHPAGLIARR